MTNPDSLINTTALPAGFPYLLDAARAARAYHALQPYPKFGFKGWKTESRGPLPLCMPFVRQIVKKGAFWLMGKPLSFTVEGNDELSDWLNEAWSANYMPSKAVNMAEQAALSGATVLKGSWDEEAVKQGRQRHPFRISYLDAVENCRLYYDPADQEKLLMARVEYPYFDYEKTQWFLYREDWTDNLEVHYEPMPIPGATKPDEVPDYSVKAEFAAKFQIQSQTPNKFGVVPFYQVKNLDAGYWYGVGDLWRLFLSIDRLNLTYDLANKDNQLSVYPKKVLIDLEQEADDMPFEDGPGSEEVYQSVGDKAGSVQYLEAQGKIRDSIVAYAEEVRAQIYECAGAVDIRPGTITNKGNLTEAVMSVIYQPLIEMTGVKRQTYGESGICKFFETMLRGFDNAGVFSSPTNVDVTCEWPPYFNPTEDALASMTNRFQVAVSTGFMTKEQAARKLALAQGETDVEEFVRDLEESAEADAKAEDEATEGQREHELELKATD